MNIPNIISLVRLFLVPLAVYFIISDLPRYAFWVFLGAGLSDAIDGFIARRWNLHTTLGAYLDPLADKALLVSVFVALGHVSELPNWIVIIVVSRDLLIIGGAIVFQQITHSLKIRPLMISKVNTTFQIILAGVVLLNTSYDLGFSDALRHNAVLGLIYLTALTSVLSGAAYVVQASRQAKDLESE